VKKKQNKIDYCFALKKKQNRLLFCRKNWVLVCWWWHFDWSFARLISPVVTATPPITISSNKIQNGDILVPANPGPSGKWPLKVRQTGYCFALKNILKQRV